VFRADEELKKKKNKKMKKLQQLIVEIIANPQKPKHTSLRAFQNAMHFETLFFYKGDRL
jgi:hypothetical protein